MPLTSIEKKIKTQRTIYCEHSRDCIKLNSWQKGQKNRVCCWEIKSIKSMMHTWWPRYWPFRKWSKPKCSM